MLNLKDINPIGIDITDQALYAAQFQDTRQGKVVGHLFSQGLVPGEESDGLDGGLVSALKSVAKTRQFRGKVVNMLLPEKHLNSFIVAFDLGADEALEDAIARECRRALSFPLEEAVVDYASLMESSQKKRRYKVTIVAAHRKTIDAYLGMARRAGLSVAVIDLHLSSLLRLHSYLFALEDAPVILCNVDDTTTLLSVVTNQRILAQRQIPWGIKPILDHLVSNLELDDDDGQAAVMLARYGLMHDKLSGPKGELPAAMSTDPDSDLAISRTLFRLLTPYMEELIHELYQITGYVRSEMESARFQEIIFYGWASAVKDMDQYVANRLNVPTSAVNPMNKLIWRGGKAGPEDINGAPFAPALGLALRKVAWL
jgi:type IV pilus assembly protein PilM